QPTTSSQSQVEYVHLSYLWKNFKKKGFLDKAVKLLKEATMETSNTTIKFFVDIYKKELAYNTIARYHTAISEVHNPIDGNRIGYHPDIARTIISIYKKNPPPDAPDEVIDIVLYLDYIISLGDNDTMSILNLQKKTAFLLTLTSASKP
ncbi:16272_t:CDS:2, partial [Racocetra persica]